MVCFEHAEHLCMWRKKLSLDSSIPVSTLLYDHKTQSVKTATVVLLGIWKKYLYSFIVSTKSGQE